MFFVLACGIITTKPLLSFQWRSPRPRWQSQLLQPHLMGDYTITLALHGIITAKPLLYFNAPSARPRWQSQLLQPHLMGDYTITLALHGIITAKPLLYFSAPSARPPPGKCPTSSQSELAANSAGIPAELLFLPLFF